MNVFFSSSYTLGIKENLELSGLEYKLIYLFIVP
jgi:hypothetical protein